MWGIYWRDKNIRERSRQGGGDGSTEQTYKTRVSKVYNIV